MRTLRLLVAPALAALAVAAALLASDARSWHRGLANGDAVYAAAPLQASWTPQTRLGGLAEGLLGLGDDLAERRALRLYAATVGVPLRLDNALDVQSARARAQDALATVARSPDGRAAAQARTLLGLLAFGSAARGASATQLDAAVSDFTDAIRADPSDDNAKYDLELVLRLSEAHGSRTAAGPGAGAGATGRKGAGGGTPGRGY